MEIGSWGRCKVMSRVRGKITRLNKLFEFWRKEGEGIIRGYKQMGYSRVLYEPGARRAITCI